MEAIPKWPKASFQVTNKELRVQCYNNTTNLNVLAVLIIYFVYMSNISSSDVREKIQRKIFSLHLRTSRWEEHVK